MNRPRLTSLAAVLAAGVLMLSACAQTEQGPNGDPGSGQGSDAKGAMSPGFHEKEQSGEPTSGGTLTLADYAETRSLDPTKTFANGFAGGTPLVAVYDQLVRWNERDQAFEPRLAESVEPNADHTQWTITLRDGATFSDGTPVNADAVIGSFNYYMQQKGFDLGVIGPLWAGAEKVDDRTVQVNLKDSWAGFPFALGMGMGFVVAPAAIADGPDGFTPIGAGAFTYESYSPSEELVLAKNPNYWDGGPYLDKLRLVWLGADETKSDSLSGGSVHVAMIRDTRVAHDAREADVSGWLSTESLGNMITINHVEGRPGSNPKVNQALAHAVDPVSLYDRVMDGHGLPSTHLFHPESKWYNEDAAPLAHDPEKARALVEEAKAEGFDGKIMLTSLADPVSREQALTLQAQFEAVGFTVENDLLRTPADQTTRINVERNFDFARNSRALSDHDPYWRLFSAFHSSSAGNVTGYADPELDALIEELRSVEGDDRRDVLNRIEQKFLADLPGIPLGGNANFVAWADQVQGVQPTNDTMLGFEKAWIATD